MNLNDYLKSTTQQAFAEVVGVTQGMVARWAAGESVSAGRARSVAAATEWRVTPHELRPDLYPNPDDGLPPEIRAQRNDGAPARQAEAA